MKTSELEKLIFRNYDWSKVNYEMTCSYIPPIKYGKVVKVNDGNTITIATKLAYIDDTNEESNIYRFIIYLDSVCVSKNSLLTESDKINIKVSKDELSKLIFGRIVELKDINTHNNGHLYATVFLDSININDWMLEHKYVIKCKNNKRRVSENNITLYESESEFETYNKQKDSLSVEIKQKILEEIISLDDIKKSIRKSFDFQNNTILPDIKPKINNCLFKKFDCFLSHNWGVDNINHKKISLINEALLKRGLKTWFDEKEMEGNIRFKMAEGIDNTSCVIVFITQQYRDKVNSINMKDNCKYEFTYAVNQLGPHNMIPIIMEKEMCNTYDWKGELGAALGSMLYINFTEEKLKNRIELEKKYDDIYNTIIKIIKNNKNIFL